MEQKIVRIIKENNIFTPEEITEKIGIAINDVEDVLVSLEEREFIKIVSGGSKRVLQFEIIKNLDELL